MAEETSIPSPQNNSQQNNPFIVSDNEGLGNNSFIHNENGRSGLESSPMSKPSKQPEVNKPGSKPSIFKGEYGVARSKYLSFVLGKKDGYGDFKSHGATSTVRQKMVELRDKMIPKNQEYIKERNIQLEVNKMKRELGYKTGDDHTATVNLLKEIEDKTGIK